jgi:branched chain amino acid efflux pump
MNDEHVTGARVLSAERDKPGRAPGSPQGPAHGEALAGARAMLPWLGGVVPFGMVVGMTAAAGRDPLMGLATGPTIYGGSAQLTAIRLLDTGASTVVVVASVLVINARLLFYGGAMAPHWTGTGRGFRALAAYLLVDPSYAVGLRRYAVPRRGGHAYYVGAAVTLWIAWHAAMLAGWGMGGGIPDWVPVQAVVPLFLLAEVTQAAQTRPALIAALVAAVVAVFGAGLPLHSSLLAAVLLGVASAVAVERRRP